MSTPKTFYLSAVALVIGTASIACYEVSQNERLAREDAKVRQDVARLESNLSARRTRAAKSVPTLPPGLSLVPRPQSAHRPSEFPTSNGVRDGRPLLAAHPELRDLLRARCRAQIATDYAALYQRLQLSPEQIARFEEAIVAGTRRLIENYEFPLDEGSGIQLNVEPALQVILGAAGYQQFLEYQRTRPARSIAADVATAVYYTDTPLSPAQADQLTALALQTMAQDGKEIPDSSVPWDSIITQARSFLTEAQLAALTNLKLQSVYLQTQNAAMQAASKH